MGSWVGLSLAICPRFRMLSLYYLLSFPCTWRCLRPDSVSLAYLGESHPDSHSCFYIYIYFLCRDLQGIRIRIGTFGKGDRRRDDGWDCGLQAVGGGGFLSHYNLPWCCRLGNLILVRFPFSSSLVPCLGFICFSSLEAFVLFAEPTSLWSCLLEPGCTNTLLGFLFP